MAKKSLISLQFPMGGLDKAHPYQSQPPYTTPDCQNVRPMEVLEGRGRGGQRPGIGTAFQRVLGSGTSIRMISEVSVVLNDTLNFWADDFKGETLGDVWNIASWINNSPSVTSSRFRSTDTNDTVATVRDALIYDTTKPFIIELLIVPFEGEHHGNYHIFTLMGNSSPNATTLGLTAELNLGIGGAATGAFSGTLFQRVFTHSPFEFNYNMSSGEMGYAPAGWFKMYVEYTGTSGNGDEYLVACYWMDEELIVQQVTGLPKGNMRFGFGMACTNPGGVCLVDTFRIQYHESV